MLCRRSARTDPGDRLPAPGTEPPDPGRPYRGPAGATGHDRAACRAAFSERPDRGLAGHRGRTVRKWRGRWLRAPAVDSLGDPPRSGRRPRFAAPKFARGQALACTPPAQVDEPLSRWSCPELARHAIAKGICASVSASTVQRWLTRPPTDELTGETTKLPNNYTAVLADASKRWHLPPNRSHDAVAASFSNDHVSQPLFDNPLCIGDYRFDKCTAAQDFIDQPLSLTGPPHATLHIPAG